MGEQEPDGLSSDLVGDSSMDRFLGDEQRGPARATRRCRSTHHGDDRRLLRAVEEPLATRPRIVGERHPETAFDVALADARRLTHVATYCLGRLGRRPSLVEQQQHTHAPPRPRSHQPRRLHATQLGAILLGQLQPGEAIRLLHPICRSNSGRLRKFVAIRSARAKH